MRVEVLPEQGRGGGAPVRHQDLPESPHVPVSGPEQELLLLGRAVKSEFNLNVCIAAHLEILPRVNHLATQHRVKGQSSALKSALVELLPFTFSNSFSRGLPVSTVCDYNSNITYLDATVVHL